MLRAQPLPSGTITFVAGEVLPDAVGPSLEELLDGLPPDQPGVRVLMHPETADEAVEGEQRADTFVLAFERASTAIAAAVALQRLAATAVDDGARSALRLGIHTGEVVPLGDGYGGRALLGATQLRDRAHGGQIVVSAATGALTADHLPAPLALQQVQGVRLAGSRQAARALQVIHPSLRSSFPPLIGTLPAPLAVTDGTSFVGRERELGRLDLLARDTRLVTIVGPGGVGKTRLLGEWTSRWHGDDAPVLIDVTTCEPDTLAEVIRTAVRLPGAPSGEGFEGLAATIGQIPLVVGLDNCEHVIEPLATGLTSLLARCPGLRVITTSREPLGVPQEHLLRLLPLPVPDAAVPDEAALRSAGATRLFLERAAAAGAAPTSAEDAPLVAEVCRHLDGLPLAIELAAAQMGTRSLQDIADRMSDQLTLLRGSHDGDVAHHASVAASIGWSVSTLTETERILLRRLSALPAPPTRRTAVALLIEVSTEQANDALSGLVDKSLVLLDMGPAGDRYRMLESVRQFACAELEDLGEVEAARSLIVDHYVRLADEGLARGDVATEALSRLAADEGIVREVARWAAELGRDQDALTLSMSRVDFWWVQTEELDVAGRMREIVDRTDDPRTRLVAQVGAARMTASSHSSVAAHASFQHAVQQAQAADDTYAEALALTSAGWHWYFSRTPGVGVAQLARGYELAETLEDELLTARATLFHGVGQCLTGGFPAGRDLLDLGVKRCRDVGVYAAWGMTYALFPALLLSQIERAERGLRLALEANRTNLNTVALDLTLAGHAWLLTTDGRLPEARDQLDAAWSECVTAVSEYTLSNQEMLWNHAMGNRGPATEIAAMITAFEEEAEVALFSGTAGNVLAAWLVADGDLDAAADRLRHTASTSVLSGIPIGYARAGALAHLAQVERRRGNRTAAVTAAREAFALAREHDARLQVVEALEALAGIAIDDGDAAMGRRLLGSAAATRDRWRVRWQRFHRTDADIARAAGSGTEPDGPPLRIAEAESLVNAHRWGTEQDSGWATLTPTEGRVAAHLTQGLSNREIAAAMFISENTVKTHVRRVLKKLGVQRRAEVAAAAARRG